MEKIVVDFEVNAKGAEKNVVSLTDEVKKLNKNVTTTNKQAKDGLNGVQKGATLASKGFKLMGTALKAAGIGLVLGLLSKLAEVFMQNQKVADAFSGVFEGLSILFNDFVNFVLDSSAGVLDFFKGIFVDPVASMKSFAEAFRKNIQERFESYLETLGFLSSAIKKVFSGDFVGALEDVKSAGKESLDVLTGVNNTFDKGVDFVESAASAIVDYTKEVVKSAKENVKLANSSELAASKQSLLIEKYDIQAEKLRQIRDEERNSIADRIKANNDLKEVLEAQEIAMLKQADLQIASARANVQKNNSIENQVALTDALANREGVLAQIQGFRSEQLANDLALDREKIELTKSKEESENKLSIERKRFNAEQIEDEVLKLERFKEIDEEERILESARLQAIVDNANAGTQAKIDAQIALAEFEEQSRQQTIEREKELSDALNKQAEQNNKNEKKWADLTAKDKKAIALDGLNTLTNVLGKQSALGKAAAIANATISTYESATSAYKSLAPIPIVGPVLGGIAAGAAVVSGIANVKKISSTQVPGGGGGGGATPSAPQIPTSPSTPPSFNVVGQSSTNQLANAIGGQSQQPVQAYVVANDVSTAQSLDRNIVEGASI